MMTKMESVLVAVLVGMTGSSAPAGEIASVYTSLDLSECRNIETLTDGEGSVWSCQGYNGIPVQVAADDLRYFVSYGENANARTVAQQTLTHFNTIHTMLEWRVERRDNWEPFATILRYFWERGDHGPKGETLVVTKLGVDDACHVAYVSASDNRKANDMARTIADNHARTFDCKRDKPTQVEP